MGKRSDMPRRAHDAYDTPPPAVWPLIPHLPRTATYVEPCAGKGALIRLLKPFGLRCVDAFDIAPRSKTVRQADAVETDAIWASVRDHKPDLVLTNPPWTRDLLHPLLEKTIRQCSDGRASWFLIDAGWAFSAQSYEFMRHCTDVVPLPRIRWIEGTKHGAKDDCAWFRFEFDRRRPAVLHPRPA